MTTTQNNGTKPAALSFTYVDEDMELDEQLELDQKRMNIGPTFSLKKDDEQTIRFVAWKNAVKFMRHQKYDPKGGKDGTGAYVISTICPLHVGKECVWHAMGLDKALSSAGVKTESVYGWQVWNVTGQRPQLLTYAMNQASPLDQLFDIQTDRKKKKGSIEDLDLSIKQLGEARTRKFNISKEAVAPTDFSGEIWGKDLIAEKLILKYSPELIGMKPGDSGQEVTEELDTDELASNLNI